MNKMAQVLKTYEEHHGLQWVLVEGELHHVSDYVTCKQRPTAFCPICEQELVLKLGKIKIHHAAHKVKVDCAANNPETIIHLNSKFHIAQQLQNAPQKTLMTPTVPEWMQQLCPKV